MKRSLLPIVLVSVTCMLCAGTSYAQWTQVNAGLANRNVRALVASDTILFAGTSGTYGGVYRSLDQGQSWSLVNTGMTFVYNGSTHQATDVLALASCRKNRFGTANTIIAGTNMYGIYASTNYGGRWYRGSVSDASVVSFAVQDTTTFLGTSYNGSFRSIDGGWNYTAINTGLADMYGALPVRAFAASSTHLFAGIGVVNRNTTGVYRSTDFGASWTQTELKTVAVVALAMVGSDLYAGIHKYDNGPSGVYRSTDYGASWTPAGLTGTADVYSLVLYGSTLFAGTSSGFFRTSNNGADWVSINEGLPGAVGSIAILGTNMFVGVSGSGVYRLSLEDALPIQLSMFAARSLTAAAVELRWTTLSETNNYGFEVQKTLTPPAYQSIPDAFIQGHGSTVAPSEYTWTDSSARPGMYYRLKQIDLDGTITYSDGICAAYPTGVEPGDDVPRGISLEQNYPNPFNPSTTIRYSLPDRAYVTLTIVNTLGQPVAVLQDEERASGHHEVRFDASGLASGVYFSRIQVRASESGRGAGDFLQTRKLVLLR